MGWDRVLESAPLAVQGTLYSISLRPSTCLMRESFTLALNKRDHRGLPFLRKGALRIGEGGLVAAGFKKEARRPLKYGTLLTTRASTSKPSKPPPKPPSTSALVLAVVVPLLLAGGAVIAGNLLLQKIHIEAMEEADEMERLRVQGLLKDGPDSESETTTEMEPVDSGTTVGARNRPKREE